MTDDTLFRVNGYREKYMELREAVLDLVRLNQTKQHNAAERKLEELRRLVEEG